MQYTSFENLLKNIHNLNCIFERRPKKYKFGIHNYGEIPGWYNKADGDPWDVFAPGYNYALPLYKKYKIQKVIGVYFLENGNHKIAVRINKPTCDARRELTNMKKYCRNYTNFTKIKGRLVLVA